MTDPLQEFQASLTSGPRSIATPSQSNTVDLTNFAKCVYVGVSGDLKITTINGDTVTFTDLAAGVFHPIPCRRVWSTGTTATDILIGYD